MGKGRNGIAIGMEGAALAAIVALIPLLGGCRALARPHGASGAEGDCPAIANAERVLAPGAHMVLGEMHGNAETPRFVGALACLAAKRGGPVRVGLEIPVDEQRAIETFLTSMPADRAALWRGPFWTDRYQDGRRSEAMVSLLDTLRTLRHGGADVNVVAFDGPNGAGADRDQTMATRLAAAFSSEPKATFIVLCGNVHARKAPLSKIRSVMAGHLLEGGAKLVTLNARYGGGTTWACTGATPGDCGPIPCGSGAGAGFAVHIKPSPDGAYDGVFDVGAASFSPPAAVPMTEAQRGRAATAQKQTEARAAYEGKKYARCAELYAELAQKEATGRADSAYNAACCYALAGLAERAFGQLADAADHGLKDADWLAKDEDLAALRADARWTPLLERVRGAR